MKAEVLKPFRDKETGEKRNVGEVFTCTKKRFNEIRSVDPNLVAEVVEEKDEKPAE